MADAEPGLLSGPRTYSRDHPAKWSVIFIVVCLALGLAWAKVAPAMGATRPRAATHSKICKVNQPDLICPPAVYAQAFQSGYYTHAPNGVPVKKIWNNPANARDAWVTKIAVYMNNHQGKASTFAKAHRLGKVSRRCSTDPSCFTGLAKQAYDELMEQANCVSILTPSGNQGICDMITWNTWITVDSIKNIGSVALCGGSIIVGFATKTPPATLMMGGAGACWGAWIGWSS